MRTVLPLTLATTALVAAFFCGCGTGTQVKPDNVAPTPGNVTPTPKAEATRPPARIVGSAGTEVTFFPTYGYRDGGGWKMRLRGWAHADREHLSGMLAKAAEIKQKCAGPEMATFEARADDFIDDDDFGEKVVVKFDKDPDDTAYEFGRSGVSGVATLDVTLTEERARRLLEAQGSAGGWLTYRAVSDGHSGLGRVRLIEPEGLSLVSDIDDTIKVTEVTAGSDVVLRNTFCLDFKPAPGMKEMYAGLGDVAVHYVSGGPEQMFGPLYDYLITGPGGFPEGTFHLKFFPKNLLMIETTRNLKRFVSSPLDVTYDHKLEEITRLMERFPNRQFILVGDSGEIDPEVYAEVRRKRGDQVKEIWIRDVINENTATPTPHSFRFEGMKVIPVDTPACVGEEHFERLSKKLIEIYKLEKYERNTSLPCGA